MNQLQKHEDLKKKMIGNDESSDEEDLLSKEEAKLKLSEIEAEALAIDAPLKGLMAMKFMQRNINQQKEDVLNNVKRAKMDLDDYSNSSSDDEPKKITKTALKAVVYSDDEEMEMAYFNKFKGESSSGANYIPKELEMEVMEKKVHQSNLKESIEIKKVESLFKLAADTDSENEGDNPWLQETHVPLQRSKSFKRKETSFAQQPKLIIKPAAPICPKPTSDSEQENEENDKQESIPHKLSKQELLSMAFGHDDAPEGFLSSSEEEQDTGALLGWGSWSNQKKQKKPKAIPKPKVLKRVVIEAKMQKSIKPYMVRIYKGMINALGE